MIAIYVDTVSLNSMRISKVITFFHGRKSERHILWTEGRQNGVPWTDDSSAKTWIGNQFHANH